MNSPFTGGRVRIKAEKRTATFRRETFEYISLFYQCVDTQEKFTTTELDIFNTLQVYNQYKANVRRK